MHPYALAGLATAVLCGITGSSSGGLTITLQTIGEQLLATGANPEIMHRLMAIAAGSLDSLPHCSSSFLLMPIFGLTHKEAYKFCGVTTVVIPTIVAVILTASCIFLGL
jgi:H+/gluconate symporter-like permease